MTAPLTRRRFAASLAGIAVRSLLPGSARAQASQSSSAHTDVASMEGTRILAAASPALKQPVTLFTTLPTPKSKQDFYSELTPDPTPDTKPKPAFRDHATALRLFSNTVVTLTAAFLVTHQDDYALRAGQHLYAWLVDPATRMSPNFTNAGFNPAKSSATPAGLADAVPLAELARALAFLVDTAALSPPDLDTAHAWLGDLQTWLATDRNALIAREAKDHAASSWLLLSSTIARTLRDEKTLDANRHRFRTPTLRNQVNAIGFFPHEAATAFPYRNTLFNFDLLAAACQSLSSPFDDLWNYELEDGPGMRSIAAALYPAIKDPARWPYIADPQNFRDLPGRRPALLFAGRAFDRSEYVDLWRSTPAPDLAALPEPIAASFPITQPLLWTARAPHAL